MTIEVKPNARPANNGQSRFVDQRPIGRSQPRKKIDLSASYEIGLTTVLSLPAAVQNRNQDEDLAKQFRFLYEAANGRQVSTVVGLIAIAPAVAPWLKDAPLSFATREEFSEFITKLTAAPWDELYQPANTDRFPKKEEGHD